jgi:hypothetical protein
MLPCFPVAITPVPGLWPPNLSAPKKSKTYWPFPPISVTCLPYAVTWVAGSDCFKPMLPTPLLVLARLGSPPHRLVWTRVMCRCTGEATVWKWPAAHILTQGCLCWAFQATGLSAASRRYMKYSQVSAFDLSYFRSCLSVWISRTHLHDSIQTL